MSEATAREIDGEIKDIIDRAYNKARRLLTENVEELHRLARGLLEHETLSGDEIRTVLRGEPVIRKVVDEPAPESRRASVPTAGRAGFAAADGWSSAGTTAGVTLQGMERGGCSRAAAFFLCPSSEAITRQNAAILQL